MILPSMNNWITESYPQPLTSPTKLYRTVTDVEENSINHILSNLSLPVEPLGLMIVLGVR